VPDSEKKGTEVNYIKQYLGESGYVYDATNIRKRLANEAYGRYTEQEEDQDLIKYAEEQYIKAVYPKEMDEYLVEGAVLTCTMVTNDSKKYRDKEYAVTLPKTKTNLFVTENENASGCEGLRYATVKDTEKGVNIPPFRCNCMLAPYNDKEWEALEADESCIEGGTCRALMNLNEEWDNLPSKQSYMLFWNEKLRWMFSGITMSSILFCKHGGIITPIKSGQMKLLYTSDLDMEWYKYNKKLLRQIDAIAPEYDELIQRFKKAYDKNQSRYQRLAKQMNIPPELLAVIHYRENSDDYLQGKFNVYLHNGETLGIVTTKKPEGLLYYDFDEAALDAIDDKQDIIHKLGITYETRDMVAMLCFMETYNGKGYYIHKYVNPYLYSGTNIYVSGKYVSDGNYNSEAVDKQVGCYVLLEALLGEKGL